jgi:hydroxypyruvate isomerase
MAAPMFARTLGSADPLLQIEYMAACGFAGIADNHLLARDAATQAAIGAALARHGMEMGSFTLVPPGRAFFPWTQPGADVAAGLVPALAAMDRVGGGLIIIAIHDNGACPTDQYQAAGENLGRAAAIAAAAGRALGLEPVSPQRVPGVLVQTAAQAALIIAACGSTALKLVVDCCHLNLGGEDIGGCIREYAPMLGAVQVADMPGRVEPGAGVVDFAAIRDALVDIGWAGLVEAECFASRPGAAGEAAMLAALNRFKSAA